MILGVAEPIDGGIVLVWRRDAQAEKSGAEENFGEE
jgi:hypothetical protein